MKKVWYCVDYCGVLSTESIMWPAQEVSKAKVSPSTLRCGVKLKLNISFRTFLQWPIYITCKLLFQLKQNGSKK